MVNVLVNPMSLDTNVSNVLLVIGIFLHVQNVLAIRMGLLIVLVISQVGTVLVLIMLVVINVIHVIMDGMISQAVKNVVVTLLVPQKLVVPMMVDIVHAILDMQELNVMSVLMDGICIMGHVMRVAILKTLHSLAIIF